MVSSRTVTTIAGNSAGYANGVGTSAQFYRMLDVSLSPDDSYAVITDKISCMLKKLDMSTMQVSRIEALCQLNRELSVGYDDCGT